MAHEQVVALVFACLHGLTLCIVFFDEDLSLLHDHVVVIVFVGAVGLTMLDPSLVNA